VQNNMQTTNDCKILETPFSPISGPNLARYRSFREFLPPRKPFGNRESSEFEKRLLRLRKFSKARWIAFVVIPGVTRCAWIISGPGVQQWTVPVLHHITMWCKHVQMSKRSLRFHTALNKDFIYRSLFQLSLL